MITPIVVVEVILESSDFLKYRGSYKSNNRFKSILYKHQFRPDEGRFFYITPIKLELYNLREKLT